MMYALRAEWTKVRTLRSTGWLLLAAIGCTVTIGVLITAKLEMDRCAAPWCYYDYTKLTLSGVRLGQVGVVLLGVLAVTAEYGTRTIMPTLISVPRRLILVLAKLGVVAVLGLLAGIVAVWGSLVATPLSLPWDNHLTQRAAVGTVLYFGLLALMSGGVALVLRDTAGSLIVLLAVLYAAPIVALFVSSPRWQHRIHRFSPMDAGLAIQATRDFAAQHIGPWGGVGLLSIYAGAAVVLGTLVFLVRDA